MQRISYTTKTQGFNYTELDKLVDNGIIRPSNSCYAPPAYPILKRNGEIRLVVDYRRINAITEKETCTILGIQDQLIDLQESKFFSTIDLRSGYYQIEMDPESIKFTAFIIAGKHYEFIRMPFGLMNAPRTFQRTMTQQLGNLKYVRVYLDDILIHSPTLADHSEHVKDVLYILTKHGITINYEKSKFCSESVNYLGHVITGD